MSSASQSALIRYECRECSNPHLEYITRTCTPYRLCPECGSPTVEFSEVVRCFVGNRSVLSGSGEVLREARLRFWQDLPPDKAETPERVSPPVAPEIQD